MLTGLKLLRLWLPESICISAVAFLEDSLRKSEVFLRLSSLLDFDLGFEVEIDLRAILMA